MAGKLEIVISAKDEASKQLGTVHDSLVKIGGAAVTGALAAAAAGVAALGAAAVASVNSFLNWGETLDGIGDVLGTSADESAALAVAIQGVGGNVEGLTAQMAFMARGLVDAEGALEPVGEALTNLGVGFQDANGALLPTTDILQNVANVIGNMPDGLEKTNLMTRLFGKSGKDLSDTLGALANGGLAKASQKAKEFGLAVGDIGANAAVMFGRKVNDMKMQLQGLGVQLGGALIGPLSQMGDMLQKALADPAIQAGIDTLVAGIANFATQVVSYIPIVVEWLGKVGAWFRENPGIIFGVLAALGVAIGAFVYTVVVPAAIAMVTAFAPIIAVFAVVAAAFYLLYEAWTNNWGGIRTTLTAVWEGYIKPAFDQLVAWLQVNIPIAIQWLSDVWNTVFLPALQAVWEFIQAYIIPIFQDLWTWLTTNIPPAIAAVKAAWDDLLAGLKLIWNYIQANIIPIFERLINKFKSDLLPVLSSVADFVGGALSEAFLWLQNAVKTVVSAIQSLIAKAAGLKNALPDWLIPGSPTPLELGLRGISAAMNELSATRLPAFTAKLNLLPEAGLALAGAGGGGGYLAAGGAYADQSTNYYQLTINSNAPVEPIVTDFEMMRAWS